MASSTDGSYADTPDSSASGNNLPLMDPAASAKFRAQFLAPNVVIPAEELSSSTGFYVSKPFRLMLIYRGIVSSSRLVQRPLSQDEASAMSKLCNVESAYFSLFPPSVVILSLISARAGARTFRFPFYQPKASFHPNKFPSASMPLIGGRKAAWMWHGVRFLAYSTAWTIGLAPLHGSLMHMLLQEHMERDPRLKQIRDAKSNAFRDAAMKRRGISTPPPPPASADATHGSSSYESPTPSSAASSTSPFPYSTPEPSAPASASHQPPSSSWDDDSLDSDDHDGASPVSPAARRGDSKGGSPGASAWDRLRRGQQSDANSFQQGDSSPQASGWAHLRQDSAPQSTREGSPAPAPFAYTRQDEEREQRGYDKEKGSVWARLRQNNAPQSTGEAPPASAPFAYTRQDEEREQRRSEKEKAQKEFDAMVEAERQGDSSRKW